MEAGSGSTLAPYKPQCLAMVKERQTNKTIREDEMPGLCICVKLTAGWLEWKYYLRFHWCLHLWLTSHLGEVWESWCRPVIILLQINSKSFDPKCPHGAWGESTNNAIVMTPIIYPMHCRWWLSINQTTTPWSSKRYVGMINHSQFPEDPDSKSKETLTS